MITESNYDPSFGQEVERLYTLSGDIEFDFENNYVLVKDPQTEEPEVRVFLGGGTLEYQVYDQGSDDWGESQTLTPVAINANDSNFLPHNNGNDYIEISSSGFEAIVSEVERLLLSNSKLLVNVPLIEFADSENSPAIEYNGSLNEALVIKSNDSELLSISPLLVRLANLELVGLKESSDPTSAVTKEMLESLKPSALEIDSSEKATIENSVGASLVEVSPFNMTSNVKMEYGFDPGSLSGREIVDADHVQTEINQEVLSKINEANGVAGLNSEGRIDYGNMEGDIVKVADGLETVNGLALTTDFLPEGTIRKYYDEALVSQFLDTQKGVVNGVCPLSSSGTIPSEYIPSLSSGDVFSGLDANKTSPAQYPSQVPDAGDRYIATDTSKMYVLASAGFEVAGNWKELTNAGDVLSVNSLTGVVVLTTDNVSEGSNHYFNTGINNYLAQTANTANNLLKLDNVACISTQNIANPLEVKNGSVEIYDDLAGTLAIRSQSNLANICEFNNENVLADKIIRYNSAETFALPNDIPSKYYVDNLVENNNKIQNLDTKVEVLADHSVAISSGNNDLLTVTPSKTIADVMLTYGNNVLETDDNELISKKYVDDELRAIVEGIGSIKEYVEVESNEVMTSAGIISPWNITLESSVLSRILVNNGGTFTLNAGTYRIYVGLQVNDEVGNNPIRVSIENAAQTVTYFDFMETSPNNNITQTYPTVLSFSQEVEIGLFVIDASATGYVNKTYFMIEEFVAEEPVIGEDRISDIAGETQLLTNEEQIYAEVAGQEVFTCTNEEVEFEDGIKVLESGNVSVTDANQLVPKSYVDSVVNTSTFSVSKLGQIAEFELTADEVGSITVGTAVEFNNASINTSTTMHLMSGGEIQLTGGFVYRVDYEIAVKFVSNTSLIIFAFADSAEVEVPKSRQYSEASQASLDSAADGASFLIDLRSLNGTKNYSIEVKAIGGSIQRFYSISSKLVIEEIEELNDILEDRIENISESANFRVAGDVFTFKANSVDVATFSNSSNHFRIGDGSNNAFVDMKTSDTVPISFEQKTGLSGSVSIDQPEEFITKSYAETSFAPINELGLIPAEHVPDVSPVGLISALYGSSVPTNWLLCNGSTFSQAAYPELYTFLGTNVLPDLRGYFLRGLDSTGTRDPDGATRTIGSVQEDSLKSHTHDVTYDRSTQNTDNIKGSLDSNKTYMNNYEATTVTSTATGVTETRPKNVAVNFIIKAKRDAVVTSSPNFDLIANSLSSTKIETTDANQIEFTVNSQSVANISQTLFLSDVLLRYASSLNVNPALIPSNNYDLTTKAYVDTIEKDFLNIYSPFVVEDAGLLGGFVEGAYSSTMAKIAFNFGLNVLVLEAGQYEITGNFMLTSTAPDNGQQFTASVDLEDTSNSESVIPFSYLWRITSSTKNDNKITNSFILNLASEKTLKLVFTAAPTAQLYESNVIIKEL